MLRKIGPRARLGQATGDLLTRLAFAVMIKMSGKLNQFIELKDDFEGELETIAKELEGIER